MKKLIILLLLPIIFITGAKAQSRLSGTISDPEGEALPGASVLVLSLTDSSLVKGGVTNAQGKFLIQDIENASYIFSVSSVGFETRTEQIRLDHDLEMGLIKMDAKATELQELEVTASRPFFEQRADRLIVNVQTNITSAGGSALDVLERSPGVLVNRGNNSLSLNGKDGIPVMINGKVSRLSPASLMQLLNGTSAENVEKIELITNPPAKYEAAGTGGIINIELIKRTDLGTNGSVTVNAGYGQGEKAGTSLNINHRKGNINVYGDFSFSRNHWLPTWHNSRKITDGDETSTVKSTTYREPVNTIYNGRIGLDYQFSEKTLIGGFVSGFSNLWDMDALISGSVISTSLPPSFIEIDLVEKGRFKNLMSNFNLSHQFGKERELNLDFDYLYFSDRNKTTYENFFPEMAEDNTTDGFRQTNKKTPLSILVGRLDFSVPFSEKVKLETGLTGTVSALNNEVMVRDLSDGVLVTNHAFSENSDLTEIISGLYATVDYALNDKTRINAGLRHEYSVTRLELQNQKDATNLQYGKFFPTLFASRKLGKDFGLTGSYGRRITRPSFGDLAPFFIFIDPSSFYYGNTALRPGLSDNFKIGVNYKQYMLTLDHTYEHNAIQGYQPLIMEGTSQQIFTTLNLPYIKTNSLVLSVPVEITSWWSMNLNLLGVNTELETPDKEKLKQNYYRLNLTKNFRLPSDFSIEASGFYQSGSLAGISRMGAYQSVNLGAQKKFGNDSKLRLSFSNIFGFNMNFYTDDQQGYTNHSVFQFERRIVNLAYTFPFGNENLKKKRNRATGSEDIRKRVR